MSEDEKVNTPESPMAAYKALIDLCVEHAIASHTVTRIESSGIYSNALAHNEYNQFLQSLTDNQRKLISDMLIDTRSSVVHDILSELIRIPLAPEAR
ncbi:MAG: DUF6547 family protein [Phycisphaeraceae bacterium]